MIPATLEVAWRLLRGGGRRGLPGSVLTLAAVAVSTGLLLFTVGAGHAFGRRADADAWRHPAEAKGTATAIEALSTDYVSTDYVSTGRGPARPITIIDLASLDGRAPVPPGMARFPRPGEAWLSPALARLARKLPADRLAARLPAPAGTLGAAALVHPDELVAVVGRAPADPAMTAPRDDASGMDAAAPPTRIDRFRSGAVSAQADLYRVLMLLASALMAVPLLVFGGAAARLTVARRDARLAALRLVGATPGQVVAITAAEAVLTAAAGALAGVLLYAAAAPALAHVTIAGGGWPAGALWPGPAALAAALAAVPALTGISAVAGLRRVVVSPLGVARRETPPALRAVRIAALGAVLLAFGALGGGLTGMGRTGLTLLLVLLALAFLALNLAGPWAVALIGRVMAATARRPARLLAGRRLMDDPRAAWRTVAGIALTGFVAGFLAPLNPPGSASAFGAADRLRLTVPHSVPAPGSRAGAESGFSGSGAGSSVSGSGRGAGPVSGSAAVADRVRARLAGTGATVAVTAGRNQDTVSVTVSGGPAAVDRARTALAGVVPGRVATTPADDRLTDRYLLADLRTGAFTVLAVSFLIAVTSAGITGAAAVLDRRRAYTRLRLAGTPLPVLDRARRQETLVPLVVMGGGSLLTGLFFATPFAMEFGGRGLATLGAFVALGFGGILGASALSRPLLRAVTADPAPRAR